MGLGPPFDPPLSGRPNFNCKFKTFGLLDIRHKIQDTLNMHAVQLGLTCIHIISLLQTKLKEKTLLENLHFIFCSVSIYMPYRSETEGT